MNIRLATEKDVDALLALDGKSGAADAIGGQEFLVFQDPRMLDFYLECKGLVVAEEDGRLAGYVLTHLADWMHGVRKLVWVEHIGVHPDFRRQGIGLQLLRFVRDHYRGKADCLHGSIHPANTASLGLFEKLQSEMGERVLVYKSI